MNKNGGRLKHTIETANAYGLEVRELANGHLQMVSRDVTVNYWPNSKKRTVYIEGGSTIYGCTSEDAVRLCLSHGGQEIPNNGSNKKKTASKSKRRKPEARQAATNPAGIENFYSGVTPPWVFPTFIMAEEDRERLETYKAEQGNGNL